MGRESFFAVFPGMVEKSRLAGQEKTPVPLDSVPLDRDHWASVRSDANDPRAGVDDMGAFLQVISAKSKRPA